ncbi:MAG: DUF4270 domain-containing protein [Tannerella sp.]|jgi:hypothetical protein|nr:DUF4270 domain-containing protein [Tannerella sp.]
MNIKQCITTGLLCLGWLILSGCSDSWNLVGPSIQPDDDRITVFTDTFQMSASTVKIDSLFAKMSSGYLGEIYDPLYGRLKSDYLCQFYCQEDWQFARTPYEGKIDSLDFYIEYTWAGDVYTPMQIQLYPITKPLDKVYYTHVDPADYCDLQHPLATQVFTVSNGRLDSMQQSDGTYTYYREMRVRLPAELGQRFYDETVQNPSTFKDQESFNQFFPGLYVTTGYGSGALLHIDQTLMVISYRYVVESSTGTDSLVVGYQPFMVSKDVIQLNRFENTDTEQLLADNEDYTFLKTPAGIFTRLVIPAKEIKPVIEGRIINNLLLELKYMPQEDWIYALAPPPQLLLLPEDSLRTFFENGNIENSIITYLSSDGNSTMLSYLGYSADTRTYSFLNIANLLNIHLQLNPDEDLRLLVVPVSRTYQTSSSGSSYYYYTTALSHYLAPSGVKLRKDKDYMKIAILSSKYVNK